MPPPSTCGVCESAISGDNNEYNDSLHCSVCFEQTHRTCGQLLSDSTWTCTKCAENSDSSFKSTVAMNKDEPLTVKHFELIMKQLSSLNSSIISCNKHIEDLHSLVASHATAISNCPRQAEFLATLSTAAQPSSGGRRHSVVTISRMPPAMFGRHRRESVAAFPSGGAALGRVLPNRRESIACPPSTEPRASFLLSIIGITNTVGRIACGYFADFPQVNALFVNNVCLIISAVAVSLTPICHTYGFYIAISIMFGIAVWAAAIVGSPLAGALYDATHSYKVPFYVAGGLFALAAVTSFLAPCLKGFGDALTPIDEDEEEDEPITMGHQGGKRLPTIVKTASSPDEKEIQMKESVL
ncbi:unnamed protein product [Phaedon cochleariae]|uniref:Phorbol-ester/DAG-type domain-containing protein n=1 Tax=Phaedon cochleariae TaxID=80249 RepID=A0A9P0DWX0_PHACE|nr:unnamed protein product [Phaedon cochleariae]